MQPSVNNTGAAQPQEGMFGREGLCHPPLNLSIPVGTLLTATKLPDGKGLHPIHHDEHDSFQADYTVVQGCQWNYGASGAPIPTLFCSPWTLCYKHEIESRSSFQERPKMLLGMAWDGAGRCSSWFRLRVCREGQQLCLTMVKCRSSRLTPQNLKPQARTSKQDQKYTFSFFSSLWQLQVLATVKATANSIPSSLGWTSPDGPELIPVCSNHWAKGEKMGKLASLVSEIH